MILTTTEEEDTMNPRTTEEKDTMNPRTTEEEDTMISRTTEEEDIRILSTTEEEQVVVEDFLTDLKLEDTVVTIITITTGEDHKKVRGRVATRDPREASPLDEAPPPQSWSPSLRPLPPSPRRPLPGRLPCRQVAVPPWRLENVPLPVMAQCWLDMVWSCSVIITSSVASWTSSLRQGRGNVSLMPAMSCWAELRGKGRI